MRLPKFCALLLSLCLLSGCAGALPGSTGSTCSASPGASGQTAPFGSASGSQASRPENASMPDGEDPQTSGGENPASLPFLREAALPDFPELPVFPQGEMTEEDWDVWDQAMSARQEAIYRFRGENVSDALRNRVNEFAGESLRELLRERENKSGNENTLYSPLSLWLCLSMAARCAEGNSRAQCLEALGAPDPDSLAADFDALWRNLYEAGGDEALLLSNCIFVNQSLQDACRTEALDDLAARFRADSSAVPMGTEEADRAVNAWISRRTRGLITPDVRTSPDTLALLLSSLYFKAAWSSEFQEERTGPDPFTASDGATSRIPFLHKTAHGYVTLGETWTGAELSLGIGRMIFVLPEEGTAPEDLLNDPVFFPALLSGDSSNSRLGEIHWSVPKLDLASDLTLSDTLRALGITDMLDPEKADLSGLTDLPAFFHSASQFTRLLLDEKGVEAAAVTILEAPGAGAPPEDPEIFEMNLNRPFLFVLSVQGMPLLTGVVHTL